MNQSAHRATIPHFSLPASTGQTLSLDSFKGKVPLVIVFHTGLEEDRDFLTALNERLADFGAERAQILAVVKDTATNTRRFAEEAGIVMPILADPGGGMFRDFDAEEADGSLRRVAVVAGIHGEMVRRFDPLPADRIVDDLLGTIRELDYEPLEGSDG